jgi:CysZ protein
MFASARKALAVIFDPAFSGIVARALLFTILLFAGLFIGAEYALNELLPTLPWSWVKLALEWLTGIAVILLFLFLGAPVAAIFASFYLDDIAEVVEARYYPADPKAPGTPFFTALRAGTRLAVTVVLVNIALLPFAIAIPLFGEIGSLLVNGWLLGREYFELAALRHMSRGAADALRRRHSAGVFLAGLLIAILTVVPLVNLLAPLLGSAFMVHQFKRYSRDDRPA